MKKLASAVVTTAFAVAFAVPAFAQSPASNKAFFATNPNVLQVAPVSGQGWSSPMTVYDIPKALKTSNGGAVSAILSMETALWTYNLTQAIITADATVKGKSSGSGSSSSRAAIKAWVELDGVPMEPAIVDPITGAVDGVVYDDRLQATGLTVNLLCSGTDINNNPITCNVTGDVTLELFQKTKSAHSFVFYLGPLSPTLHSIVVKAQLLIECRSTGKVIDCPQTTLDGYANASTMAAIGKASLMIEEQQNFGSN